jgi:hypothetical protein
LRFFALPFGRIALGGFLLAMVLHSSTVDEPWTAAPR